MRKLESRTIEAAIQTPEIPDGCSKNSCGTIIDEDDFTGWRNERIVPELSDKLILEHLQKVQRTGQIKPSEKQKGKYNLTIEMETGVGKTCTYIKTMYELNKRYGDSTGTS